MGMKLLKLFTFDFKSNDLNDEDDNLSDLKDRGFIYMT